MQARFELSIFTVAVQCSLLPIRALCVGQLTSLCVKCENLCDKLKICITATVYFLFSQLWKSSISPGASSCKRFFLGGCMTGCVKIGDRG